MWREERASAARRKNDGETKSVHLFSFFLLLCATRRKREREREREREKNKQKRRFTRVFARLLLLFSAKSRARMFCTSKGYYLGCKFKFPYSLKCSFQVFGGYLFTTSVSAQVVLFFQRRFWTARNTKSLSHSPVSGEKKGDNQFRRSPFILNPHALCKRKEHTHTRTL